MKKVLHIGKYYPPYFGGIEKVSFDLVEGLNDSGVLTDVICFNNINKTVINRERYSIFRMSRLAEMFSVPISISYYFKLFQIVNNYDIVHLHLPNPSAVISLVLTRFEGKIIVHWHSDIVKQKLLKILYSPFDILVKKRAKRIIVTSKNYLDNSKDLRNYKGKCRVIPLGIDNKELISDDSFFKELKNKYEGKKIIFSLGRLSYYKGFNYLIEAAKELKEDSLILLAGSGGLYPDLEKQIIKSNLGNRIKLLGKIPYNYLGSYFKLADVFCLPSVHKSEAFGVVLIEAMSFGCPQVVFNIKGSGVPWVVENKKTGFVVEVIDAKRLADKLQVLIQDDELRHEFSRESFVRYNSLFKKQDMISKTLELYKSI